MRFTRHRSVKVATAALFAAIVGLALVMGPFFNAPVSTVSAASACSTNNQRLVPWLGGRWYLSGVNIPWQNGGFGADFGTIEEWGQHTYSSSATAQLFSNLKAAGVNSVRWWVFADGRGAPEFNANSGGGVTGFDANTLSSMADAIKLAQQNNIYIVFNLWSFDMFFADSTASANGEHAGGHRDMIVDATKRSSFINNAVVPMLNYQIPGTSYTIGSHPNVLGWDIINEPEWAISESDGIDGRVAQTVPLADMRRFVAEVSGAIHRNSNQLTTVGSAAMKWNSDSGLGVVGNWWRDDLLTQYDAQGYLDFYQIHYYGWMNGDGTNWSYSPAVIDWTRGGFNKPTVIGEFPANAGGTGYTIGGLLDKIYSNCYAGVWGWSYYGVDGAGTWSNMSSAITQFNAAHSSEVAISSSGTPAPTSTALPPTATATRTSAPPTATATRTPAPPTATATRTPAPGTATATAVPPTATRTPAPVTATATTQPGGSTTVIYADSPTSGWVNWSWNSQIDFASTRKVYSGTKSIGVTYQQAWAGLYAHNDKAASTTGRTKLRFWVHPMSNTNLKLAVWTRDSSGKQSPQVAIPVPAAARWTLVEVPLSQLGSPANISDIVIQEAAGRSQPTFYVDQVELAP